MLIYADNGLVDPWPLAQIVVQNTEKLAPLVAVQPVYMHPYAVAKIVTTLGLLYRRRVALNMVAGGFRNDLLALGDPTEHDERYTRLIEYTLIIRQLLEGNVVSMDGKYHTVKNLKLTPPLDRELLPPILISGSSSAGMAAAAALDAVAMRYPRPAQFEAEEREALASCSKCGIRIGIVARADHDEAWRKADEFFPSDRRGQLAHKLAMKVSDSVWHKQLSGLAETSEVDERDPYWLVPMQNYQTFCPYLVGNYDEVAEEIARYLTLGFETFIFDVPRSRDELEHVMEVFRRAQ
jgi:alkanesulfonate monooxygenase